MCKRVKRERSQKSLFVVDGRGFSGEGFYRPEYLTETYRLHQILTRGEISTALKILTVVRLEFDHRLIRGQSVC